MDRNELLKIIDEMQQTATKERQDALEKMEGDSSRGFSFADCDIRKASYNTGMIHALAYIRAKIGSEE